MVTKNLNPLRKRIPGPKGLHIKWLSVVHRAFFIPSIKFLQTTSLYRVLAPTVAFHYIVVLNRATSYLNPAQTPVIIIVADQPIG